MHGHDFLVIAEGKGPFNPSILNNINKTNPTRRDVVTLPATPPGDPNPGGYLVIAFPLDNPGIWVILSKNLLMRSCIVILRGILVWDWECNSWRD